MHKYDEYKFLPFYSLKKISDTSIFQGNSKRKKYFEGWYFKMVSKAGDSILSVIPGISLSETGEEKHAFIQLINGITAQTSYFKFPINQFSFSSNGLELKIGDNYFSKDKLKLNLNNSETAVSGEVEMFDHIEYSSDGILDFGIMGWYRFVPFMECYHGVVSLTHNLKGSISINNGMFDFNKGKGYIEKDWGSSMPSAWIWIQSNNFYKSESSFMLSIANIPWMKNSFTGFLGYFYDGSKLYRFATYLSTKLRLEFEENDTVKIELKNKDYSFSVKAKSSSSGLLKAPLNGAMDRRIPESIDAILEITVKDNEGNIIMDDFSEITGLEMVGNYKNLQNSIK
jgi:hypothetical protein